jgi:hypothetical protein
MDQNNNVFFWENGTLYGCGADIKPLACPVNKGLPKDKQLPTELELLFGTDGTLYAQDSSNGALSALIPTYTFPMTQGNISSPTHLRVGGKADRATTLSAHGSVLLRKGFTVKKGASLTIKTNQP